LDTASDLFLAMDCEMTIGCSSLLNRPTPNFVHPAAIIPISGTWVSETAQAPINFGINGTTIRRNIISGDDIWVKDSSSR
jgi:hypothetical protein